MGFYSYNLYKINLSANLDMISCQNLNLCLGSVCRCQSIDIELVQSNEVYAWGIWGKVFLVKTLLILVVKKPFFSKPSPQYLSQWMSDSLQRSVTTGTKKWLSPQLTHHTGSSLWLTLHIMQDISGTLNPICINMFLVQNRGLTIRPCHHKTTTHNLVTIRPQFLT